jgi:hypothetical protein
LLVSSFSFKLFVTLKLSHGFVVLSLPCCFITLSLLCWRGFQHTQAFKHKRTQGFIRFLFLSYELHFTFYYGFKIPSFLLYQSFVGKDFLRDIIAYRNVVVVYEGKLCCNLCKLVGNPWLRHSSHPQRFVLSCLDL